MTLKLIAREISLNRQTINAYQIENLGQIDSIEISERLND